jgi:hypothetical protein
VYTAAGDAGRGRLTTPRAPRAGQCGLCTQMCASRCSTLRPTQGPAHTQSGPRKDRQSIAHICTHAHTHTARVCRPCECGKACARVDAALRARRETKGRYNRTSPMHTHTHKERERETQTQKENGNVTGITCAPHSRQRYAGARRCRASGGCRSAGWPPKKKSDKECMSV